METILAVQDLEKYYGGKNNVTKAVDGISFSVAEGQFVGIMGPSGSGKTTLLNCISTIDRATTGHIYIRGMDITELSTKKLSRFRRNELGFIFQDFNLLDTLTAYENIALALTILKTPAREIDSSSESSCRTAGDSGYPAKISFSAFRRSKATGGCGQSYCDASCADPGG